jgi:hypothetical protein
MRSSLSPQVVVGAMASHHGCSTKGHSNKKVSLLKRVLVVPWLVLTGFSVLACSSDDKKSEPQATPASATVVEVRTVLGPDGGTIEGKKGTELEGVRLTVPAGTLAASGEVWIRLTFDGVPLPNLAERVGLQVLVGSKVPFSKPVNLTLPYEQGKVDRFGKTGTDVKVWVRQGETWSLVEQSGSTTETVTVPLSEPTTAAAGVKVQPVSFTCKENCDSNPQAHFEPMVCASSGLCLTAQAKIASSVENFNVIPTPDGQNFNFLLAERTSVIGMSHTIVDGTSNFTDKQVLSTSLRANVVGFKEGIVVGLGSQGNVMLPFGGAAPKVVSEVGLGAIRLGNGKSIRLRSDNGKLSFVEQDNALVINHEDGIIEKELGGVINHEEQFVADFKFVPTVVPSRANVEGLLIAQVIAVSHEIVSSNHTLEKLIEYKAPAGFSFGSQTPIASSSDSIVAAIAQPGAKVVLYVDKNPGVVLNSLPFPAASIEFDANNNLLISSSVSPEIAIVSPRDPLKGTSPNIFSLTSAKPDSAEYAAALPRGFGFNGEKVFLMLQDQTLLSVVLPSK